MAKTLTQLIADVRQHIAQPDATNSQFTDAQLTIWLNDAYQRAAIAVRHLPTSQQDYSVTASAITLNSATIDIDEARLQNPDNGNKYYPLKVIKIQELIRIDPSYENVTASTPTHLVQITRQTAILYPTAKASIIALTTPLRCLQLNEPTALSSGSDIPDLPGNLHDIIGHYAAYRCYEVMGDKDSWTSQLTLFNQGLKAQKGLAAEFTKQNKHWKWTECY